MASPYLAFLETCMKEHDKIYDKFVSFHSNLTSIDINDIKYQNISTGFTVISTFIYEIKNMI